MALASGGSLHTVNEAPNARRSPAGMRRLLSRLILVVLVPLLLVQAGIYVRWYYSRLADEQQANLEMARAAAAIFDGNIDDVRRQEWAIGQTLAGPYPYTTEQANQLLLANAREYPAVRAWHWTNPNGKIIASSDPRAIGLDISDRDHFRKVRKNDNPPWTISDFITDRTTGDRAFYVACRIDDKQGKLFGVVTATIEPDEFNAELAALRRGGKGIVAVFDRAGVLTYSSDKEQPTGQSQREKDPLLAAALDKDTEQLGLITLPPSNESHLAARVPVGKLGWVAGTRHPVRAAMADVYRGLWIVAGLNLLVAIGSGALAAKTGGTLIAQLRRLQTHAQAIGRGDFGHVAEIGRVGELAELAATFNQMGVKVRGAQEALEAANASLEERVRERTAELAATIQRLEQTERELRTTSLYARSLIEASLDPLVTISPDGKITDVNEATETATGLPRSQLIGTDFSGYFTEPDLARNGYRQVLSEGLVRDYALTVRHVSGRTIDVLYNAVVYTNETGERQGVFAAARDITGQKQAEEALRESERRYRTLFESIDEGFCVAEMIYDSVGKAVDYRFLEINPAFEKQTGLEQAQGKTIRELVPNHDEHWFQIYDRVARTGEACRFESLAAAMGRWFDVYAFRLGGPESRKVAILFNNINGRKRMEEELCAASSYARGLLEASLDPLVTISREGKITDVNEATETATGVPRGHLIGTDFSGYFTEPDLARKGYRQVLSEGLVRDYPLTIRHISGSTIDVLYNAVVYRNETGEVQGVFAAARDVTEQKRVEAELAKHQHHLEELVQQRTGQLEAANAQLQAVFDVANVGMLLIDERGVVKRVNKTLARWVGRHLPSSGDYQPGDIVGCVHALAAPKGCGTTDYCHGCPIRNAFETVLRFGNPVHDVETEAAVSIDGKENRLWLEVSADPVVLDGKRNVILAMNNITARKRAEEAVERLASFPRLNPTPIAEVDLNGRVHYINPAAEQLFPDLQRNGNAHPWLADWESVVLTLRNGDSPVTMREVLVGEKWYQQTIHYIKEIERVRFYGPEITARKRAEEALQRTADQLKRSNEELEQFAYVASHDLQEPLRVVTGYVQLIDRKYKNQLDADADQFLHYIVDGVARMQQLITDLLNYSRVGSRNEPFRPTDVQAVVDRALVNLQPVIEETDAVVTCDSLATVHGDEAQLVQLFQNLIGNGIKFRGDRSPRIHISARRDGSRWEFAVRDNGIGIEKQYWDQIFVIFQRLHKRQDYPGTGIGLAICKRIVERHGGQIWLDSESGQGTTFRFTLS